LSRITIKPENRAQEVMDRLYGSMERRLAVSPPGLCPVDMAASFLRMTHAQSCGKCVPCRVGLGQLQKLLDGVLEGRGKFSDIDLVEKTARAIKNSADCAIGFEAAEIVLRGVVGFRDDYIAHIEEHDCICNRQERDAVPCVALCPAEVDVPGYIALVRAGKHADAVRLIRHVNPFPTACAYVCEHPCETRCRRKMVDNSINIRGIKRAATDTAGYVPPPECAGPTGKKVAVIGGGPSGMTAAYYLRLMGHSVKVFEKRDKPGGMLRYGIPSYRLPRERLQDDLNSIIAAGVEVETNTDIDGLDGFNKLREEYDAVYIAIGAHTDKKLRIPGEDSRGVISAVQMLRGIGDGVMPDFKGKKVIVVGGGNVAMDVARSSVRLGASVQIAYRRRKEDMTALPEEVDGAIAEGCEVLELQAPVRVEADENGDVKALWVQPQIIGPNDRAGRPAPRKADAPEKRLECDLVLVSIGQGIESGRFKEAGLALKWDNIAAASDGSVEAFPGVFSGGDCVTGPATVIRAIAGGKVAAANIDRYLGYNHEIKTDIDIPAPRLSDNAPCGRVQMAERAAEERKRDFVLAEIAMTGEEAAQECSRCLRCDRFGYGGFKGGRNTKW
jgi:NADPH-dependent glutamate synthase beta subunit-like oxidoreductase